MELPKNEIEQYKAYYEAATGIPADKIELYLTKDIINVSGNIADLPKRYCTVSGVCMDPKRWNEMFSKKQLQEAYVSYQALVKAMPNWGMSSINPQTENKARWNRVINEMKELEKSYSHLAS